MVGLTISLPMMSPQTLAGNSEEFNLPKRSFNFSPANPKVHTDPGFWYLSEITFYPKKHNRYTFVKIFWNIINLKKEQLDKIQQYFALDKW